MRVIDELISYLWHTHKLDPEDMMWLSHNGYCDDFDLYDYDYRVDRLDLREASFEEDVFEEAFADRKPRKSSGATSANRFCVEDLVARLTVSRLEAAPVLQELLRFSQNKSGSETVFDVANWIARGDVEQLQIAVLQVLCGSEEGLSAITRIIACNYIHIEWDGKSGPAVQAYQKLVASRDIGAIGKYSWILKKPEIARAYAVARAQARLADALGSLLQTDETALARALVPFDPDAFWFLCLLTTHRSGTSQAGRQGLIAPRPHKLPTFDVLYRLADLALGPAASPMHGDMINERSHPVGVFLLARLEQKRTGSKRETSHCDRTREAMDGLRAFEIWDKAYRPPEVFDHWENDRKNHE